MIRDTWDMFVNTLPWHAVIYPTLMFIWFVFGVGNTVGFFVAQTFAYLVGAIIGALFYARIIKDRK